MFQILHCADLHLDTSFASGRLPAAVGSWRRADLRATLGRILTLARERQVDAVTIAGDLYEQDYALPDTADFLVQQFAKLAPIRLFIAPGERDPYTNDSLHALTRWPENITVFSQGQLSAVEMAPGIYLWGAACPPARGHRVLDNFHVNHDGINLLLLHAADAKQSGIGSTALFSVDAAAVHAAGFDFALLGHQHSGRLWPEDAPCCVYPGSPEPLAPQEADDAHQIVLLRIQDRACTPEVIPVSQWRYLSLRVDLTDCSSTDKATTRVEQSLQSIQMSVWCATSR
jgi:exonuclease SbcD